MQRNCTKMKTVTTVAALPITNALRRPIWMCLSALAAEFALTALTAAPVSAQTSGVRQIQAGRPQRAQGVQRTLPEVRMDARSVRINKRPAIPFKPLDMVDLQTGKPISPDTLLTTPSGTKLTARDYYAQLNELERQLNAIGYSLRSPDKKVVLQESLVDRAKLQRQKAVLTLAHRKLASGTTVMDRYFTPLKTLLTSQSASNIASPQAAGRISQTLRDRHLEALKGNGIKIAKGPYSGVLGNIRLVRPPHELHLSRAWGADLGDPSVLAAYARAKFNVDGMVSGTSIHGELSAGGSLFGNSFEALRVTGDASIDCYGNQREEFDLSLLGSNAFTYPPQGQRASNAHFDTFSQPWDVHQTWHGMVGPIPVSATIGAHGDLGFNYGYLVASGAAPSSSGVPATLWASGYIAPFVHSSVYGDGSIDLGVAQAGIGASMTLINDDLTIGGQAALNIDASNRPYFHMATSANNNFDALDGHLFAFVKVGYDVFSHEFDADIWNWSGYQSQGYLWDDEQNMFVFDQ